MRGSGSSNDQDHPRSAGAPESADRHEDRGALRERAERIDRADEVAVRRVVEGRGYRQQDGDEGAARVRVNIENRWGCALTGGVNFRKVHITKQTRDLLRKSYNITPCAEGYTDPVLSQYNIETFLVSPVSWFSLCIFTMAVQFG